MGTVGELTNQGFIVASRCPHSGPAWKAIRFKTLAACKLMLEEIFEDLAGELPNMDEVLKLAALGNEMDFILETDFSIDHPVRKCMVGNSEFLLGDVAAMKSENIWKFDQFIKIEHDHLDCGVTTSGCKYANEEEKGLWSTNM